ncbi:MAG: amidohydrolase family protein, partial [Alphaproteobacteria bacterium]
PVDALRFATSSSADLIGLEEQGRVSEGMAADFLIVDGNPADVITMASRKENHREVIKGGVVVSGANSRQNGLFFGRMAAF